MSYKIKICGLSTINHVEAATDADFLGFVVGSPQSKRNIELNHFENLSQSCPAKSVAVTASSNKFLLKELDDFDCIVQLHGEARNHIDELQNKKAISVSIDEFNNGAFSQYYTDLVYLVIDSSKNGYGGTGKHWNWEYLEEISIPILVAGGISRINLKSALTVTQAQGVDISSGVEVGGMKSLELIKETIQMVKCL